MAIRQPAFAGQFYPDNPVKLTQMLENFLIKSPWSASGASTNQGEKLIAMITPHAGYIYSGGVAMSAYQLLKSNKGNIKRICLLGPSHRVAFKGIACSTASHFRTPLGDIALDGRAVKTLCALPYVGMLDEAHAHEHSLEVHLPFLQYFLGDGFTLVPLVVGEASATMVAKVIEAMSDEETLIIVSSDLSHYHSYETAKRIDADTVSHIQKLTSSSLQGEQACGCRPINGLIQFAKHQQLDVTTVDVKNSGDTAGPKDRVVGYASFIFTK